MSSLPTVPFVVLDTETTGFIPKVNRVIEFASVQVRDGKLGDEYEQLIGIDTEIPPPVQVLTRIRPETIQGKPTFDDVREEIVQQIGDDTIIVGQNVGFDIRMLKGEGIDLSDRPWIDTSMLASLVFPELESYSLSYVSAVLNLKHDPVHRALGDVHATLELLERCWERFCALPADMQKQLKEIMSKGSRGYKQLFEVLPESKNKDRPAWLEIAPKTKNQKPKTSKPIPKPESKTVDLLTEPLDSTFLQGLIDSASSDTSTVHWIAVKNLTAQLRRLTLNDEMRILQPPFLLLDQKAADTFLRQDSFTADEATLALKLLWHKPQTFSDTNIHGEERAIWNGKLACTEQSKTYTDQFTDLPSVMLLDHKQLLSLIANSSVLSPLSSVPQHIIVDDASMLEDTATKAYGWYCSLDAVRAAAEGDDMLTRFTDVLQIWIEKVRNFQDLRYLTPGDLQSPDASGLRDLLDEILERDDLADQIRYQLSDLQKFLQSENLKDRIAYIEQRQNGSQFLQSAPERVGDLLKEYLYDKYPVTLLIPPESDTTLTEILPPGTKSGIGNRESGIGESISIQFPDDIKLETLLSDPPAGKTVVLAPSRRIIEQAFVQHTEDLEKQGVTFICQNLSGGQGRMQAEFLVAKEPVIWMLTPWTFEGIELDSKSIDRLVIDTMPFDHPAHAVFSRRAEHYKNAFEEYSLPRLEHRLFRLLRTFMRYAGDKPEVLVLDKRLKTKSYGKRIVSYLELFEGSESDDDKQLKMF